MKFLYVLTSSPNDLYYEQFFLSVTSLRLHNPNACIVALIDSKTKENLTGKRKKYKKIISETVIIHAPEEMSQREVSRWIKTSMKKYITGDFLYIDCDTVITENLDCNFPSEIKIGAVLDTHVPLARHHLSVRFEDEDKELGFTSSFETGKRYNGGVIFCRDTHEGDEFFSKWHSLWLYSNKKGNHHDMPSLNQANYEMGGVITDVDGE
jgi:lipopolysaccharide biosynthesis glycosyltransferase